MSEFIHTPHPTARVWGFFDEAGDNVARVTLPEWNGRDVVEAIVRREGVEFDPTATESRLLPERPTGSHWEFHRIATPYPMIVGNREVILPVGTLVQLFQMDAEDEEHPGDQFIDYGAVVRPVVSVPELDEWNGVYLAERGNEPLLIPADRVQHARITNAGEVSKFLLTLKMLGMYWHLDDDPAEVNWEDHLIIAPTEIVALRERQREIWNVSREAGIDPHEVPVENVHPVA